MSFQMLSSLINGVGNKPVIILCHHNADPDALCSAFALSRLLKRCNVYIQVEIAAPQGISLLAKHLQNYLKIEYVSMPRIEEAGVIVIVDTNTLQQLESLQERIKNSGSPIVVIDHHAPHPETAKVASLMFVDDKLSSTCEIVYGFYRDMNLKPDLLEASALFVGMAYDSRHFILANSNTFKTVGELLEVGVKAEEIMNWLSLPMAMSERVARLKASQRMRFIELKGWIVAFSHVSAYQASSARALVNLGVHVAAVAGEKKGMLQMSLRASNAFHTETNIHLGRDIAAPLGRTLKGMGGGHATSAGVNGFGDIDIALAKCEAILKDLLA